MYKYFHILVRKLKPVRPIRATVNAAAPRNMPVAAQICAPRYVPPSA